MKSVGVVVEYNPFHNGHAYHVQAAKKVSGADVVIAVMSGNFLQRGEPAIIDKHHRTKAALSYGVDLVLELPYAFAVQNSDYFAEGAVQILHKIGVSGICFGGESGDGTDFKASYRQLNEKQDIYTKELRYRLNQGLSFPESSMHAYKKIGLTNNALDLSQPNNILGFSYVKSILDKQLSIDIHTVKRVKNHFHEPEISSTIASATSIRKNINKHGLLTEEALSAMPKVTSVQLEEYINESTLWHNWENYFQLVNYRVQTMDVEELRDIHGITEGLEHRLKQTAKSAQSMQEWIQSVKTKRYTWTSIQRLFTHILTNTTKKEIEPLLNSKKTIPYLRILGMSEQGQMYLNKLKKQLSVPLIHRYSRNMHPMLMLEERATSAYYSVLPAPRRINLEKQEFRGPIRL